MTRPDFSDARWHKSNTSGDGGCVEVAYTGGMAGPLCPNPTPSCDPAHPAKRRIASARPELSSSEDHFTRTMGKPASSTILAAPWL